MRNTDDKNKINLNCLEKPDAFYYPGYIWLWNDKLSNETLSAQLKDMIEHKAKNVWPLVVPKHFRPDCMPTLTEPDFLSHEYFEVYRKMVQDAEKLGMKVWLYDDGGWPSGSACGQVVNKNPDLVRQSLVRIEIKLHADEIFEAPADCICAFIFLNDGNVKRLLPDEKIKIDENNVKGEIYKAEHENLRSINRPSYPDLLNPRTAKEFIKLSHEQYKKYLNEYFGNTIPLVFCDEASVNRLPWTDGLVSDFKKNKGYDIREYLPAIFDSNHQQSQRIRVDYYDWWSSRLAEAFFGQIQQWCRKNNIFSAGHLGGEEFQLGPITCGFGNLMRILRKFDMPGVDTIWRHIFPGQKKISYDNVGLGGVLTLPGNTLIPKYASSVAHQENRQWAITESFAIYGSGLTIEQMKWVTDYQYVRGINITTMGGYSLSTKDFFMYTQRPLAGPANPLWKYMDIYHEYIARLSYLLSRGKPFIETALYYPVRDIWANDPDTSKKIELHEELSKFLLKNQNDFDLIDDDILERESTFIKDGKLIVGQMCYSTIFISKVRWMTDASKRKLADFADAGGKVVWVDNEDFEEVKKYLNPLIKVEPQNDAVRVCKRDFDEGSLYFIFNESLEEINCTIKFDEYLPLRIFDFQNAKWYHPYDAACSQNKWSLLINLKFAGSLIIAFTKETLPLMEESLNADKVLLSIEDGWKCRKFQSYKIGQHDFEINEPVDSTLIPIKPGDWRNIVGTDFSGDAEYVVEFKCDDEIVSKAQILDLGCVRYCCQAELNGKFLGKAVWQPFSFSIEGILKKGVNKLKIIVTNTMANQYISNKGIEKWPAEFIGPYHLVALQFESESIESGLYGPVRIMM